MTARQIGPYEVLDKVGEGGMGEVYRARDSRLGREVALKVLPAEFARDTERLARFRREARLLASLHHTHIASLHGLEEIDGEVLLSMELVQGLDLSERLARGPLELDEALELARQFAEGLEAAHEQNIVHRDLKPANLKVSPDGTLKILDFGLARAYLGEPESGESPEQSPTITAALTGQGVILGTAAYMSPEQARGRKIDQRTDIWAFGTILFEMLTGKRLFEGETISDTMAAVLRADLPWSDLPSDTPRGVVRLLERCLERDPRRRLRDIGEARVRLERWREDPESIHESSVSGVHPTGHERRRPSIAWALCGVFAIATAVLGWKLTGSESPPPPVLELDVGMPAINGIQPVESGVALSPDGQWIAWAGRDGVWIRHREQRTPRLLEGTEDALAPAFSPDSQWIAFGARGRLLRVSVSGGTPIPVCTMPTPRGLTWVAEDAIVFAGGITEGLQIASPATGNVRALTERNPDRQERSHRWPAAIPGRRAVLVEVQFLGKDYDQSDIDMVDIDSGARINVHRGGAAPQATGAGHLLFVRANTLFAVRFDPDGGKTRGLPVPVRDGIVSSVGNQESDDGSAQYAVDRQGSLLHLYSGGRDDRQTRLAWFDLERGRFDPVGPPGQHSRVDLSPDGQLAVVARTIDGNENLVVHDLRTGDETMLTFRPSVEYMGAWSPDSKTYYWAQGAEAGDRFEVWRRPVDGSEPPEPVFPSPTQAGFWPRTISPDGRWLCSTAWMGTSVIDLQMLDLENVDAGLVPFAAGPGNQDEPNWFGNDLVVFSDGGANLEMRRFPDTGARWSFPPVSGELYEAIPAADGRSALALGEDGVYRYPLEIEGTRVRIGRPETLHSLTTSENAAMVWAVAHPDGKRLLTLYAEGAAASESEIVMVLTTGWVQTLDQRLATGR